MGNIKFFSLDQNFDNVTCCIPSFDFRAPSAQACIVSALSADIPLQFNTTCCVSGHAINLAIALAYEGKQFKISSFALCITTKNFKMQSIIF